MSSARPGRASVSSYDAAQMSTDRMAVLETNAGGAPTSWILSNGLVLSNEQLIAKAVLALLARADSTLMSWQHTHREQTAAAIARRLICELDGCLCVAGEQCPMCLLNIERSRVVA